MNLLLHITSSLLPVNNLEFSWFWFAGSLIPDIDNIFLFIYYRVFSFKKIIDYVKNEEKYNIRFKTKYVHSIFGAMALSLPIFLFNPAGGAYFFAGYIFHLILDWPDKDVKQYLYPLKKEFKGFLPISSKIENLISFALIVCVILIYKIIK